MIRFVKAAAVLCFTVVVMLAACIFADTGGAKAIYVFENVKIAYEDRYIVFDSDVLLVDGSTYCNVQELIASTQQAGWIGNTFFYNDMEYAPVRAYYESLGFKVIWDDDLSLVRVYEQNIPEPGNMDVKVTVLLYHHVLRDSENVLHKENGMAVSEESFEEQMKYLSDNGYTTITLLQLYDFLYNGRRLPYNSVLITFDDGYYSNFMRAYPILKKYGQSAVFFPITSSLAEEKADWFDPNSNQKASGAEFKEYSDVFEYSTHTHDMHSYDENEITLFYKADEPEILSDLEQSLMIVNNNLALAYPLGLYDGRIIAILQKTAIKLAFTTKSGSVTSDSDPYQINRNIIWPGLSIEEFAGILG